jgi:hypothetical protein
MGRRYTLIPEMGDSVREEYQEGVDACYLRRQRCSGASMCKTFGKCQTFPAPSHVKN